MSKEAEKFCNQGNAHFKVGEFDLAKQGGAIAKNAKVELESKTHKKLLIVVIF